MAMGRGAEHVEVRMQPGKSPGGPVAETLRSQSRGSLGSIHGQLTRSHMTQ